MSMELHAFMKEGLPDRDRLQAGLQTLNLPVELDASFDSSADDGFVPCKVGDTDSGIEILKCPTNELLDSYPQLKTRVVGLPQAVTLCWGSGSMECACALAWAAALVSEFEAVVYNPQDDTFLEINTLRAEFKSAVAETSKA